MERGKDWCIGISWGAWGGEVAETTLDRLLIPDKFAAWVMFQKKAPVMSMFPVQGRAKGN
jgi:hypothetical protein